MEDTGWNQSQKNFKKFCEAQLKYNDHEPANECKKYINDLPFNQLCVKTMSIIMEFAKDKGLREGAIFSVTYAITSNEYTEVQKREILMNTMLCIMNQQ